MVESGSEGLRDPAAASFGIPISSLFLQKYVPVHLEPYREQRTDCQTGQRLSIRAGFSKCYELLV